MNMEKHETPRKNRVIHIREEFLKLIDSGAKTLEIRIKFPGFTKIQTGDYIEFKYSKSSVKVKITATRNYRDWNKVFQSEDTEKLAPGFSRERLQKLIPEIFKDSDVDTYGLIVFEFEKVA